MLTESVAASAASNGRLASFDFDPRTRVVFGPGTLSRVGELARDLGGKRVLLVTDRGLKAAGHEDHALECLRSAGVDATVFDEVTPNPTTLDVDRGLAVAHDAQVDLIVGLGGGSSMDCAKGVNFLLSNGGRMEDFWGIGKARKQMLPMIAVPTTAGTGSEAQSFALIAHHETHMKMACGDRKAACKVAILDPELTRTMPKSVAAATAVDALSHALETAVTAKRNPISQLFSRQAWKLLATGFPRALPNPDDDEARGLMLLGAHMAGAAIENSMLGATHSLANPITARYGTTHGVIIGVMLPHVIRYNAQSAEVAAIYTRLAADVGLCEASNPDAPQLLADRVHSQVELSGQPTTLTALGVDAADLPELAEKAAQQWTAQFNPRPVDASILEELYRCAM